jgi:hypothetical protein
MDEERKSRPIGWYLLLGWILLLYIFAGYYVLHFNNQALSSNVDITVPQGFHSRLKKHGLDKQFSVIEISNGKLYFYRGGKRCNF